MDNEKFDVAVIGSGPGGYIAAIRAAQLGLKTVCIEKDPTFGGTCLNVGCIPSKALLQSTESYSFLRDEAIHQGILAKEVGFDFPKMQQRKSEIVQGLVQGIAGLFKMHKVASREGMARLTSPNRLEVHGKKGKEEIEASNIILATGSEPTPLPFLPFDEKVILSSTGALSLPVVPKKMVLVGAGVIGLELASVYRRLGAEVTILEMLDRICPTIDVAMSKMLLQILKKQGLNFHLGAKLLKGSKEDNGVSLVAEIGGKPLTFRADVVLVAVGRRPYSQGLGLTEVGVKQDSKGMVLVDGGFRTNIPHIFAIGDLIDGPMLAHKASIEALAVAEIIAGHHARVNYMTIPNVIYTHPEVATVGLTEQEAIDAGLKIKIGTASFKANPRARCIGCTEGIVKVIAEADSGRIVGLHILGPQASELIAEGSLAIDKKATLADIASLPHAHPTLPESIHEAVLHALNG